MSPLYNFLNPRSAGKMPTFPQKQLLRRCHGSKCFSKTKHKGCFNWNKHILCDPNLASPLSGLKGNHLGYFYGKPTPTACILTRRDFSPRVLWQDGGKSEFGWKAGKVEASAGWGRAAWTGERKGATLQDKGIKFSRTVKIPAQTCSRNDLSALDRVTANVGAIWVGFLLYTIGNNRDEYIKHC